MRLRLRITALAVLVAVVPLVLSGVRSVQIATREAARSAAEILVRDADALVAFVDTWVGDQAQAVAGITRLVRVAEAPRAQQEAVVQAAWLAVPTVAVTALMDADGVPLVDPVFLTREPEAGSPVADRVVATSARAAALVENAPLSEALARPGVPAIGATYVPPGARSPSVPVAAAGPYGEPLVLAAEVVLDVVAAEVRARAGPDRGVAVLTREGEPVLGADHPLVDADALAPLLRSRAQVAYALADGRAVRGAVAPIPRLGWSVVVVQPAEVAERTGAEIRRRTAWVMLLAVVVALGLGVLVARSLALPIDRLRGVALSVADGEYGRRLYIGRNDEIGELARAFNHMSGALERNRAEIAAQQAAIEVFNRELQQRVEDRTAELREAQSRLVRSSQLAAVAEVGAGLAHELNNPLAAILGHAQLLRQRAADAGDVEALGRIEAQALRCREVVAAMLRLTEDAGGDEAAAVVDLRDVLAEVLALVRSTLRQRGVAVELIPAAVALPVRLRGAFAARALAPVATSLAASLPPGATLAVEARRVGAEVHVVLRGAMAEAPRKDDLMAAGMGLWVARRLLDAADARLEGPTEGAWTLVFPSAEGGP